MSDENEAPLPRLRRSTIDLFNDEMAVLDRPLESDVEYVDEKPPAKRRWFGTIAGAALVLGGAAFLFWSRTSGGAAALPSLAVVAAPAPVSAPIIAPVIAPVIAPISAAAPPAAAGPVEAAPPTPAPLAPTPVVLAQAEEPAAAMPRVSSRATWAKAARSTRHPAPKHRRGRR